MRIIAVRQRSLRLIAMCSIAVFVLNLLTLRYLVSDSIETVNLAVLAGKTISIDPGHGGIDDGASGNGVVEKTVNLAIALKLKDILQAHDATAVLTRDADIDYYTRGKGGKRTDLQRRVELINASGAEVFVSIHVNSIKGVVRPGAQVFYGPKFAQSKALAEVMQQAMKHFPPGNKRQVKQDKDILVLNAPTMPGILIEAGFLSDAKEAVLLLDDAYQQKLAEYIAKGLAYHFSQNVGR